MAQKTKSQQGQATSEKAVAHKEKEKMPLSKMNYIMIAVCIALIAVGFFLMSGSSNEGATFNNDVFNSTRTVVAPFITFLGFILMVPAILYRGKAKKEEQEQ